MKKEKQKTALIRKVSVFPELWEFLMQFKMEADTLLPVSSQPLEKKKGEKTPKKLRAAQKIKRKRGGGGGC